MRSLISSPLWRAIYFAKNVELFNSLITIISPKILCITSNQPSISLSEIKEIDLCNSLKNIEIFSKNVSKRDDILYFIIDQVNALDQEDINKDDVHNDTKGISRAALDRIISVHYVIKSASTNYKSAMYLEKRQNSVDLFSLLGGMMKMLSILNYTTISISTWMRTKWDIMFAGWHGRRWCGIF
ncbi:hypothetical protein BC938DRAFT_471742, partial [Jimgerdemannia flammicorona]